MFARLILFAFLLLPLRATADEDFLPVEQAFRFSAKVLTRERVALDWSIADGYYLYRDKLGVTSDTPEVTIALGELPEALIKQDENFGEIAIYRNRLSLVAPFTTPPDVSEITLLVKYQGCADRGLCYPPQKQRVVLTLPAASPTGGLLPLNTPAGASPLWQLANNELLPPEQAFQFTATVKDAQTVRAEWFIAPGYYLYRDKIALSLDGNPTVQLGNDVLPRGTPQHDEEFGNVEVFRRQLQVDLPLQRTDTREQTISLRANFQGCAERGVCYPPMTQDVPLVLPAVAHLPSPPSALFLTAEHPESNADNSEFGQIIDLLHQQHIGWTLLSFFGFGLLLAFTPCVFPMIPILSGIIVGQKQTVTMRRGLVLSLAYVIASALTYAVFGVLAALFGSNLQALFQQTWIIALFSAVFVALALSMFGFYHLELPKSWQALLHEHSNRHRDGTLWGVALMGVFSSLIVGPCVAAPLAAALLYISQTGDAWLGGSTLFVMGLGMGTPLLLVGASAGKLLPKAGPWLHATKAVFGVMMLAVATWMLERILPPVLIMALWAALLIIPAVYLGATEALPAGASGWRKFWKGVGLIMLSYGLFMLAGLAMGEYQHPWQPLRLWRVAAAGAPSQQPALNFARVTSLAEFTQQLAAAQQAGRWALVDVYADWCVSCKELERQVLGDSRVQQRLAAFHLIKADVTANSPENRQLLEHFGLFGPPALLFFDRSGQEQTRYRMIGLENVDIADFLAKLPTP